MSGLLQLLEGLSGRVAVRRLTAADAQGMRVKPGDPIQTTIPMPAGSPDRLGAQIEAPLTREVVSPWAPAELASYPAVDENAEEYTQWSVTATLSPAPVGDWNVVRSGAFADQVAVTLSMSKYTPGQFSEDARKAQAGAGAFVNFATVIPTAYIA